MAYSVENIAGFENIHQGLQRIIVMTEIESNIRGKILFLSPENSAVALIAERFANDTSPEGVSIFSAVTDPTRKPHQIAVLAMKKHGFDISTQKPKAIADIVDQFFDLVIVLNAAVKDYPVFLLGAPAVVNWNLDDFSFLHGTEDEVEALFEHHIELIRNLVSDLFTRGYFKAFLKQKNQTNRVLSNLPEAIVAHDLNRKIFMFNEAAARITGMSSEEVMGRDCHDIFIPRLCGNNCSFCEGDDIDLSKENIKTYPSVFYNVKGERKDVEVTVVPMVSEGGKLQGVAASFRDQTELKTAERELKKETSFRNIVGRDHKMVAIFQQIQNIATFDAPIHIYGETGTGKELVARAIHDESQSKDGPFVPINCGALPEGLIESELFGHVKGSFSGAIRNKKGRFELADGGTIFLDEVAELPKHVQAKLLRFIQEGTLEKVGSERVTTVKARIISASNKELKKEVKAKNFRDDLYYRLNVVPLTLPPLRERKSDIPILVEHFINIINNKYDKAEYRISEDSMAMLINHSWPGNVRELENIIQFGTIRCKNHIIKPVDLPMEISSVQTRKSQRGPARKLDMESVESALLKTGGNKAKAAKFLGVGRATLYRFINDHPEIVPDDILLR